MFTSFWEAQFSLVELFDLGQLVLISLFKEKKEKKKKDIDSKTLTH